MHTLFTLEDMYGLKIGGLIVFHNKKDAFYNISLWQFRYKNDNIGKEVKSYLSYNQKEII